MRVVCIVPAAGLGTRLKTGGDKPFVTLGKKPILAHTLGALQKIPFIDRIIVSVSSRNIKKAQKLLKRYKFEKKCLIVKGGKRRTHSVQNALSKAGEADFVLIHDGARPFITERVVKKVFSAAKKYGAAICAMPVKQTIKQSTDNFFIESTPNRAFLQTAQTPQGFKKDLIVKAYKRFGKMIATDDASLVEKLKIKVKIVKGSSRNIKITTPEDLALAKVLASKRKW